MDSFTDQLKINANPHMQNSYWGGGMPSVAMILEKAHPVQKSKLLNIESKTVGRILKTLLGLVVSGSPDKGDNVRESQFQSFVNKGILQKEKKSQSKRIKGLRQILAHVAKRDDLPPKQRERLIKQVLSELEKSAPPQPGLVFDEAKGRWVRPENRGKAVHALQGGKRLRGAKIGSEKLNVGGTLQRLPKGTRQRVRGKLSQTLPKSLQRRGVQFRK